MINYSFDFQNEEATNKYVNFLQGIAVRLDKDTISYFFNQARY